MSNPVDTPAKHDQININEIMQYLPHRYPFLMIDRVLEYTPNERLVARKNVTYNEPYFAGHFPIKPIMPGVMILEALAQATGILAFKSVAENHDPDSIYYFVGIDKARFKRPVEPGDTLELEVIFQWAKRGIWSFAGKARVDGVIVCEAKIMCTRRKAFEE
ncbi:(3R)-hydroxymyristol acyl carrier protein dehydratase [Gammaproteobacteria bacterium]|nr:(3R)-hydroxymyristol acyl carrier protein dehydratase [Gammaproteobacteria bacterium]